VAAVKALAGGASGFVDSRPYPGPGRGRPPRGRDNTPSPLLQRRQQTIHDDVHDPATFGTPLVGCEAASYLVHSLSDADFGVTTSAPPKRSAKRRRWPA